ncbi:MAG: 50S ribosomal protein L35 [Candidatus Calescibacterium sp.]|jgi:large subunit ribosomal protein L35|nr:50S ribosomal protein L35 [Candidatus Calescibacterium sp.]
MPKLRTSKTVAKRIRITKSGKVKFWRSGWSHYKTGKSSKWKRQMRKPSIVENKAFEKIVKESLKRSP